MLKNILLLICSLMLTSIVFAKETLQPLPTHLKLSRPKIDLGERLFSDPRLSKDNSISCSSCHELTKGGTDQSKESTGIKGQTGGINAPTIFNSAFNFRQFWNGRAKSLKEQAEGPINNPKEMGSNWAEVITKIKADPSYVKMFKKSYNGNITPETIVDAIAEYEHSLVTPSRFDDYLRGNKNALTQKEKLGYKLFQSYGCIACHNGVNIGGGEFQKMGVVKNYFKERGTPMTPADLGLYAVTKNTKDINVFKVPSLRNSGITYPYYHDGSVKSLDEAVYKMGKYQLGREIPKQDVDAIVAFLKSLTGKSLEQKKD